jgi:hypothetical protein
LAGFTEKLIPGSLRRTGTHRKRIANAELSTSGGGAPLHVDRNPRVLWQRGEAAAARYSRLIQSGGEESKAMITAVLERALEILDAQLVATPRKGRNELNALCSRVEAGIAALQNGLADTLTSRNFVAVSALCENLFKLENECARDADTETVEVYTTEVLDDLAQTTNDHRSLTNTPKDRSPEEIVAMQLTSCTMHITCIPDSYAGAKGEAALRALFAKWASGEELVQATFCPPRNDASVDRNWALVTFRSAQLVDRLFKMATLDEGVIAWSTGHKGDRPVQLKSFVGSQNVRAAAMAKVWCEDGGFKWWEENEDSDLSRPNRIGLGRISVQLALASTGNFGMTWRKAEYKAKQKMAKSCKLLIAIEQGYNLPIMDYTTQSCDPFCNIVHQEQVPSHWEHQHPTMKSGEDDTNMTEMKLGQKL